jgi:hypothetical protein
MRAPPHARCHSSPLYLSLQMMTTQVYAASMTARATARRRPPRDPLVRREHARRASPPSFLHRDRKAVASNYRGPTNFASPPRMFPSSLLFLSARRIVPSGSRHSSMDVLPGELCFKIFHLLDHQSLAAAPQGSPPASIPPRRSESDLPLLLMLMLPIIMFLKLPKLQSAPSGTR